MSYLNPFAIVRVLVHLSYSYSSILPSLYVKTDVNNRHMLIVD